MSSSEKKVYYFLKKGIFTFSCIYDPLYSRETDRIATKKQIWNLFGLIWNPCLDLQSFCPDLKSLKLPLFVILIAPIYNPWILPQFVIPLFPRFVNQKIFFNFSFFPILVLEFKHE